MKEAVDKIFENLRYTHKIHEKQCQLMALGSFILRGLSVLLICAILGLQFWQLIDQAHARTLMIWSIYLTVFEVGVTFYQLNFNYDKLLDQHRTTAKDLLRVKNRMIVSMAGRITQQELNIYVEEVNDIYASAPQTNALAKILTERESKKNE